MRVIASRIASRSLLSSRAMRQVTTVGGRKSKRNDGARHGAFERNNPAALAGTGSERMKHEVIVGNFGIGQPVRRTEDPILVRGEGRYTDDIHLEGQVYAAIVRSPVAHGVLRG